MKFVVTGIAGFIGMHVARALLKRGHDVFGVDNFNDYYNPQLKYARIAELKSFKNLQYKKGDIADTNFLTEIFKVVKPTHVIHLAAQPGVRYSLINPRAYIQSNLVGFANILECCRLHKIEHLVYASSSSVYGSNSTTPFSEHQNVDHPVSLYAATKKSNELLAHSYSHLYGLSTTGLRFFTVYGPWGRPDMAPWLFTEAISKGQPINVYNFGKLKRDFTFIDDIAEATVEITLQKAMANPDYQNNVPDPATSNVPFRIYNIGNNNSIELLSFIETLEAIIEIKAIKNFMPMQPGDVLVTEADTTLLYDAIGFKPNTSLKDGLTQWVKWFKDYND